jgi:hypothetical protein
MEKCLEWWVGNEVIIKQDRLGKERWTMAYLLIMIN